MATDIEFEDKTSDKRKKVDAVMLLFLGSGLIGAASYFIAGIFIRQIAGFVAGIAVLIFLFLFLKNGLGIKSATNFHINSDGIFLVEKKVLIPWGKITRIELLKGYAGLYGGTSTIVAIIQGQNITLTPTNLSNADLPALQKRIQSHGVIVDVN